MIDNPKELIEDDEDLENAELDEHDEHDDEDDERLESDQRDAQDEGEDGSEENSRQLRRKRQKLRQKERARKTREENAILLRELEEAKKRLAALETRNIQSDSYTAEQRYNYALQQVAAAEAAFKEALETGDGDKALNAQRLREKGIREAQEAENLKRTLTTPQPSTPSLDARTENLAKQWMQDNPWFDPTGEDEDSIVARAVDEAWSKEARRRGISPSSEDYWDELNARVRRRISSQPERKRSNGGPPLTGRGEKSSRPVSDDSKGIAKLREEALRAANLWDDPEVRKRHIENFKRYDRQNAR